MSLQSAIQAEDCRVQNGSNSRLNALKHGLTAKTAILPWEDPAEFEACVDDFKTGLGTRNPLEDRLAQDAALASWQKDRANRCEVARLTRDRQTQSEALALRQAKEALALGNKLLHDRRGPIQLYPSRQYENKQLRTSWSGQPNDPDDPAQLLLELCATVAGVRWLLTAWAGLRDELESGFGWTSRAKITALRLLGKQPLDCLHHGDVALVFLASHAVEPVYSYAFQELRCEIHEDQWKRAKRELDRWSRRGIAPADAAAGRAALLSIVDREMARLRVLEAEREHAAGNFDKLRDDIVSVEDSKAGEQVRRLKERCDQTKLRNIEAVRKGHRIEAQGWGRTRKEREARKGVTMNDEGGIEARPFDDRLVVDEQGNVRSAEEYVEAGLARYDLELGHGPPRPSRAAMSEVVPPAVPDFARWAAAAARRRSDDGGRGTEIEHQTEPDLAGGGEGDALEEGVPLVVTGQGAETRIQNEIGDREQRSGAEAEHTAERREEHLQAGAWEPEEETFGQADGGDPSGARDPRRTEEADGVVGDPRRTEEADGVVGDPRRTEEADGGVGDPRRTEEARGGVGHPRRSEEVGGGVGNLGRTAADAASGFGSGSDGASKHEVVPLMLTGHGAETKVQNEIADSGLESEADVEHARERHEVRSSVGGLELRSPVAPGENVGSPVAVRPSKGSKREKPRMRREMMKKELERSAGRKTKVLDAPIEEMIESVKWLMPNCAKVLRDHYSRSP